MTMMMMMIIIIIIYFKISILHNRKSAHVEGESKSDTGNNRGDWKHLKITQTIPEQHTGKARN
jgi:hypothetical protein